MNGVVAATRAAGEAGTAGNLGQPRRSRLRAERQADLLRLRCRRADQRRRGVEDTPDRIEILVDFVTGIGLDQQHGSVGSQRGTCVLERADRVAHVVQAIEEADQVVVRRR